MHTRIGDWTVALGTAKDGQVRLLSGRAWAVEEKPKALGLASADEIDIAVVAKNLSDHALEVGKLFVGRTELIRAITCGLASGSNVFGFGPPGTAKSAVTEAVCEGLAGAFWKIQLDKEITKSDLYGSFDPEAIQDGRWERKLTGLATCDLAFIDEVWKGTGQVNNILLRAINEKEIKNGAGTVKIPMLCAVSASNEVPLDKESWAVVDRWLIRLGVYYVGKDRRSELFGAAARSEVIAPKFGADEIKLLAAAVEFLAQDPPVEVVETALEIWEQAESMGLTVSDRRMVQAMRVAQAYALLKGEDLAPQHLGVLRWILWTDPEDENEVVKMVMGRVDQFTGAVLEYEAILADVSDRYDNIAQITELKDRTELIQEARRLEIETEQGAKEARVAGRDDVAQDLATVSRQARQILDSILDYQSGRN